MTSIPLIFPALQFNNLIQLFNTKIISNVIYKQTFYKLQIWCCVSNITRFWELFWLELWLQLFPWCFFPSNLSSEIFSQVLVGEMTEGNLFVAVCDWKEFNLLINVVTQTNRQTDKQTNRQQTNRQAYKRFRSVDPFCLNLPSYNTNQLSVRDCFFFDTVLFIDLRSLQVDFSWISLLHRFFVVGIFQFRVNKILPVDDGQTKARRFEVACRTKWNLASDWLWK